MVKYRRREDKNGENEVVRLLKDRNGGLGMTSGMLVDHEIH